jgi:hypothetical protein
VTSPTPRGKRGASGRGSDKPTCIIDADHQSRPAAAPQRPLGPPCKEYAQLQEQFRRRAEQLQVSRLAIDSLAGFTGGLASKLLAPSPSKHLGWEYLGGLCAALGMAWLPVESPQDLEEVMRRIADGRIEKRRAEKAKHSGVVHQTFSLRFMRKIGRKGGANSRMFMSRRKATRIGRKAAMKRWARRRGQ